MLFWNFGISCKIKKKKKKKKKRRGKKKEGMGVGEEEPIKKKKYIWNKEITEIVLAQIRISAISIRHTIYM